MAIGRHGYPQAIPTLLHLLRTRKSALAARTLGELRNPVAFEALMSAARDEKFPTNRYWAVEALGKLEDERAVPLLIERVRPGSDPEEAKFAAEALGRMKVAAAVPALVERLEQDWRHEGRHDLTWRLVDALGQIGPPARAALPVLRAMVATAAQPHLTRGMELEAIRQIGGPEAAPAAPAAPEEVGPEALLSEAIGSAAAAPPAGLRARAEGLVAQRLAGKRAPAGLAPGSIAFEGPRGDGRSGANGAIAPAPPGWRGSGTQWSFRYTRSRSARVVQVAHPWGDGHMLVTLRADGVHVAAPRAWAEVGYDGRPGLALTEAPAAERVWPLDDGRSYAVRSQVDPGGTWQLSIDGEPVASATLGDAHPLSLAIPTGVRPRGTSEWGALSFMGSGLPLTLPVGAGMVLIGPLDTGVNVAEEVVFTSPAE